MVLLFELIRLAYPHNHRNFPLLPLKSVQDFGVAQHAVGEGRDGGSSELGWAAILNVEMEAEKTLYTEKQV